MTAFSVRYMMRSKKELSKTVLYEVRAKVEDTVEHGCVLCEVHAEVEQTDECDCVLCGVPIEVEDTVNNNCVLSEVRHETT
jgi:hypothetical protein